MLVARYASGKVGCAEVMAPMVRWRCQRQGSIASLERGISYLGVASNDYFYVIPTVCHGHPVQSLLLTSSLKQAWTSSLGKVLRREGDSNPRNPFGVYTLSRRASSTTRASLLRRNWLARRNSPCEFGLPPLLLLNRTHEVRFIFYSVHDRHKFSMNIFDVSSGFVFVYKTTQYT